MIWQVLMSELKGINTTGHLLGRNQNAPLTSTIHRESMGGSLQILRVKGGN